ncbi:hypothetical protein [Actinoplanes friuliensis]|uniref:Uncharacterized protein n=1 Tax=Actinoplanes friuliensis DSM 7358 TaxID=1246995 RepID=U5W8I8_9ACTN|nr:hypothetical protein [Actinoplanes friuliensis]AGZ44241.1 hypothetical protein AFR_29900 [Actinoplanes friuliensis DSM 7358]
MTNTNPGPDPAETDPHGTDAAAADQQAQDARATDPAEVEAGAATDSADTRLTDAEPVGAETAEVKPVEAKVAGAPDFKEVGSPAEAASADVKRGPDFKEVGSPAGATSAGGKRVPDFKEVGPRAEAAPADVKRGPNIKEVGPSTGTTPADAKRAPAARPTTRRQSWTTQVWRNLRRGLRPDSAPPSRSRRGKTWLPYLLIVLAAGASIAGLAVRPATGAPQETADYVILAGAAGLRWDDLDPQRTPALWQEATRGSIGWLSVRSAHHTTCPADGWLTLGAGNYAIWKDERVEGQCPPVAPALEQPDGIGANLPQLSGVVRENQDKQPYGAVPGALSESLRCTVAVGPGAAVAAARPFGRVDRYEDTLPDDPRDLLSQCVLSMVDLGTVTGSGPARQSLVAQADATLARIVAARPERSVVMVAGVSDTDTTSRLHVAIAEGPGWQGGWLTSAGTGRDGYLQLVDLAPTVLTTLSRPAPDNLFSGHSAFSALGRPANPADAMLGDHNQDKRAGAQLGIAGTFFTGLAAAQLAVFLLVVPLMIRARRHAGPTGPAAAARWLVRGVEVLLIAAALAIPAALLADAAPWWRASRPGIVFALLTFGLVAVGTAAVRFAPRYPRTLWPMGLISAVCATVVGVDLLTGAQLQLNGVAGYSAIEGARYSGVGSVGLGVFVAGILTVAGCLAQWVRRPWRPAVVVLIGGFGVVMVGSPYLGADAVGAIAVTAGVCVAAAISTGGWLTFPRFAWAAIAGLAVTIGFAVLDLRRPEQEQGSLGRALTALGDGTAGPAIQRAATSNGHALDSPLTMLALIGVLMLAFCRFSPWGGLNRVFGLHPALRAAMAGATVATVIAGVLGGAAFAVAGAAAAVAVPLAVLTTLRVLEHAADRTRPEGETDGPGGPGLSMRPILAEVNDKTGVTVRGG